MKNYDIFSYRRLRRAIGYLAVSLPIFLVLLSQIDYFQTETQQSISHFYYTNLRDLFTGTLCAIGFFLFRYKGHENNSIWKNDKLLTNVMGVTALGVALIPTEPNHPCEKIYSLIPYNYPLLSVIHFISAGVMFLSFSIIAINVFTIRQETDKGLSKSIFNENNIYRFCGYSIIVLMALIPLCSYFQFFKYSTLVLEALSLFFFGTAWIIKGRALGDKGNTGKALYGEVNLRNTEG